MAGQNELKVEVISNVSSNKKVFSLLATSDKELSNAQIVKIVRGWADEVDSKVKKSNMVKVPKKIIH